MERIVFHLSLWLSLAGFCIWQFSKLDQKLNDLTALLSPPESSPISEPLLEPGEMKVEVGETTHAAVADTPDLQVIKICQGQVTKELVSENGETISTFMPRTIAFLRGNTGIPEIVATQATNLAASDFKSEFGTMTDPKYENFLVEAANLCLGTYTDIRQYELDFAKFREEIENDATAFISLDLDLRTADNHVTLYYKISDQIFQKDFSKLLNPI